LLYSNRTLGEQLASSVEPLGRLLGFLPEERPNYNLPDDYSVGPQGEIYNLAGDRMVTGEGVTGFQPVAQYGEYGFQEPLPLDQLPLPLDQPLPPPPGAGSGFFVPAAEGLLSLQQPSQEDEQERRRREWQDATGGAHGGVVANGVIAQRKSQQGYAKGGFVQNTEGRSIADDKYLERLSQLRPQAGRRPKRPAKPALLDIPADPSLSVPPLAGPRRRPEAEASMTALPEPSMAQRHARSLERYFTPKMGGPQSRAVSQTLLGGDASMLPFGIGLQEFVPLSPYVAEQAGSMIREGIETDSPMTSALGAGLGVLQALPVAKPMARGAERMANMAVPAMARPFTNVPLTIEAVSPVLGQKGSRAFKEGMTQELIGPGGAYDMGTMGGQRTTQMPGQGVYRNVAGVLETNPMQVVYVPGIRDISKSPQLTQDVASAGSALEQEAMAGIRFLPMATNRAEDSSAMLIRPKKGQLSPEEIIALSDRLGSSMVVSHNPRLGGVVVVPFGEVKRGNIPTEFIQAQSAANDILGKKANVQYGVADMTKDRLFMEKPDYASYGSRPADPEFEKYRDELKYLESRMFGSGPEGGVQSWSRGPAYPTTVVGRGEGWQPANLATEEYGRVFPSFRQADEERDVMLQDWQRSMPGRVRDTMR
jgi:hypothetical protein